MNGYKRFFLLILIMSVVATAVGLATVYVLYRAAFGQQRERLVETAASRARLVEAMLDHEEQYAHLLAGTEHGSALDSTLSQVRESHSKFKGFGQTGEFVMARLEGDRIVFLLSHRHGGLKSPTAIPVDSTLAEPIRRALRGESGTVVGLDYRGERVLAAYEPLQGPHLGIVAKIDLAEIRRPFLRAGLMAGSIGLVFIFLGALLFLRVGSPMVRRLEDSERKYRGLFESSADMLFLLDLDGTILEVNPAACAEYGYAREELVGRDVTTIVHPDHRRSFAHALTTVGVGESLHVESMDTRRDGTAMNVEVRLSRLVREGRETILSAARDISDRKKYERELKKLNETLEQRVHERTAALERRAAQLRNLAAELTQAEQRERQRLAHLLHDHQQQILFGAKMQTGLLKRSAQPTEETLRGFSNLEGALDQAIAASKSLTMELYPPILYDEHLAQVLEWLAERMQRQHGLSVSVKADPGPIPMAQELRVALFQAVRELLFNVVKHAGTDHAALRMSRVDDDRVRIVVSDDGAGFDPARCQSDTSARGFGLFNIRERLESLGGSLDVESGPGKGTRVTLLVPTRPDESEADAAEVDDAGSAAWEEPAGAAGEGAASARGGAATTVLVVDDHRIAREGLIGLLRREADLEIVGAAADGRQAVEMARNLRPEVVIMDVDMPGMGGIEATRIIVEELPGIQVIGLSMHEGGTVSSSMLEAGAAAFLAKSDPFEDLLAAIRRLSAAARESAG